MPPVPLIETGRLGVDNESAWQLDDLVLNRLMNAKNCEAKCMIILTNGSHDGRKSACRMRDGVFSSQSRYLTNGLENQWPQCT